jgi:hypothetical protein
MQGAIAWENEKKERESAASWGVDEPWLTNGNRGIGDCSSHQMGGG